MNCSNCGKALRTGARFCNQCGAVVPPEPPAHAQKPEGVPPPPLPQQGVAQPPPIPGPPVAPQPPQPPGVAYPVQVPPPPPGSAETPRKPVYARAWFIVLACVLVLLVVGGAVGGIVGYRMYARERDRKRMRKKYISVARTQERDVLDQLKEVKKITDEAQNASFAFDFGNSGGVKDQILGIQENLQKASDALDEASDGLKKVDLEKIDKPPGWLEECKEYLTKSITQSKSGVEALKTYLPRCATISEFITSCNMSVANYDTACNSLQRAVGEKNGDNLVGGRDFSFQALGQIAEAREHLKNADRQDTGADLSKHFTTLNQVEGLCQLVNQMSDAAIRGDVEGHNALSDRYNREKDVVSFEYSFDYQAQFGTEIDKAEADIKDSFKKADENASKADGLLGSERSDSRGEEEAE